MISCLCFEHDLRANGFRVCREGKPVPTFPDHAPAAGECRQKFPDATGFRAAAKRLAAPVADEVHRIWLRPQRQLRGEEGYHGDI
jgi:hypothetical protein